MKDEARLTQEQDFVRVAMHESWYRRVFHLVQRVQLSEAMIIDHCGFQREVLSDYRIVEWVLPVDDAENVGCKTN